MWSLAVGGNLGSTARRGRLNTTGDIHHPLPNRQNGGILPSALRIHLIERLALQLRPKRLYKPPLRQLILDQRSTHQGDTLAADGSINDVSLVGEHQSGTDIQFRYFNQPLPASPIQWGIRGLEASYSRNP